MRCDETNRTDKDISKITPKANCNASFFPSKKRTYTYIALPLSLLPNIV